MTKDKCDICKNMGIFGACEVRQTTGGYACNFMPKSGSINIVIRSNVNGTGDYTWQHGCEYEVKESPSFSRFIDCPMQKTCETYRDELYKQCPLNAHPIDYRPKGCPIEFKPSPN